VTWFGGGIGDRQDIMINDHFCRASSLLPTDNAHFLDSRLLLAHTSTLLIWVKDTEAAILIMATWRADVPSRRVNRAAKTAVEAARPPGKMAIMLIRKGLLGFPLYSNFGVVNIGTNKSDAADYRRSSGKIP
jgi:hypothetical protein